MTSPSVETRSFQFSDDKSDKFWTITLEETQHTVHYGRTGTQGQQQTKEFPTVDKARQSYEKLIREKLSKGYVEMGEQVPARGFAVTAGVTPTEKKTKAAPVKEFEDLFDAQVLQEVTAPVATPGEVAEPGAAVSPASEQLSEGIDGVGRSLNLTPEDWFWATWRPLTPLQRPQAKPFDLKQALQQLTRVTTIQEGWRWNWSKANISVSLSREEAHFWFNAITQAHHQITPEQLAEQLSAQSFTGDISPESFYKALLNQSYEIANSTISFISIVAQQSLQEICLALFNLFSTAQLIDCLFYIDKHIVGMAHVDSWAWQRVQATLTNAFQKYVLPYLNQEERMELKQTVEQQLDLSQWPTDHYSEPSPIFHLAACLGCEGLEQLVESWADDFYKPSGWRIDYYHRPQEVIFGLNSPELVQAHMRRLKLPLYFPDQPSVSIMYLRAWLAHTEFSALDYVGNTVLEITNKKDAEAFIKDFASTVQSPEVAPVMLELMLSSKAPSVARQWLQDYPELAIAGLIPLIGQRRPGKGPAGRVTEAAVNWLRSLKRQGYEPMIRTCLEQQPEEVAERIRQAVLEFQEKEYTPFDDRTTPEWLQQALSTLPEKSSKKKAGWTIVLADLPAIAVGDYCLNAIQLEAVLNTLRQSKLDSSHPLVTTVKGHCDRSTLDAFAWKLFELWLTEGAPSKENWAMMAVGLLGGDVSALKLAPLIREWPGESQHQRAVLGLECLRTIGTDTALMQINGIAQKVKFKGIKQRAQECMEAIAQDRNMAREQLEDRIVPDCDLDERGTCIFDFGARQFRFVLSTDLKPMVKDGEGKVKPNLPNPGAKDDSEKAEGAIAHWKFLKKQVSEVIKIQTLRLEQAMVTGRHWQLDEFTALLVQHPLMTHLVQRLIWGGYDAAGRLMATFRVTEDQTCANANDETFDLTGVTQIGIVHPLHLSTEVRSVWGELLSDYEIVQPFQQLGRSLHGLEPGEKTAFELTRFQNLEIPIVALVRTLENLGWQRGCLHDHGDYSLHFKYFSSADVTAVVGEYEEVFVELSVVVGSGFEDINRCCFLKGLHNDLEYFPGQSWMPEVTRQRIPLGEVDPVIISEVLNDLITVAAKAP